jgi:hypothetical protein
VASVGKSSWVWSSGTTTRGGACGFVVVAVLGVVIIAMTVLGHVVGVVVVVVLSSCPRVVVVGIERARLFLLVFIATKRDRPNI